MREPTPAEEPVFGVIAEFDEAAALIAAVRKARETGYDRLDAFTPFPVVDIGKALGYRDLRVSWLTLGGGILGLVIGLALQIYTNLDYPLDIGGRPPVSLTAFALIAVEIAVIFAMGFCAFGMLALNHLPRLSHPIFSVDAFHRCTRDRFFLVIFANDPLFEVNETQAFLRQLAPRSVECIDHQEEPE